MIVSILANGAPFKWSAGLEADLCFKSKSFKLYRKVVNRANRLHSNMPLKIPGLNNSPNRSTESVSTSPQVLSRMKQEVLGDGVDLNIFFGEEVSLKRRLMFGPHVEQTLG